jgi:hypothetical protein
MKSFRMLIKLFLIIVLLMGLNGCLKQKNPTKKLSAKSIYSSIVQSTVTITTENGQGSGFFIDKDIVVTNFHVINGEKIARIIINNSREEYDVIGYLAVDVYNDLILLKVDCNNKTFIELSNTEINPGEKIYAIGSPIGLSQTISEGIISGKRDFNGKKLIQITAPISHGSSGCPIINENGAAVGVAIGGVEGANSIGFCIPSSIVYTLYNFKENFPRKLKDLMPEQLETEKDTIDTEIKERTSDISSVNEKINKINNEWQQLIKTKDLEDITNAISTVISINNALTPDSYDYSKKEIINKLIESNKYQLNADELVNFKKVCSIQGDKRLGIFSYPFYSCYFNIKGNSIFFKKTTGSQRKSGFLYKRDNYSYVFLGGSSVNDEQETTYTSDNSEAGILYKVSSNKLIMIFIDDYQYEILEIIK